MRMKKLVIMLFLIILIITGTQNICYADTMEAKDIRSTADGFINLGENDSTVNIDVSKATKGFEDLSGLLWGIGIFVAVAVGMALGIKFMISTPSGKAEVSKILVPYLIGVAVVVGALTIWRIVVTLLDV